MKTSDVLNKLEEYAPLEISRAFVAAGAYDNSGLLVDTGEPVKKAAFTLELSAAAVAFAEEEGCNLIVTHHPAIYRPVASLCAGDPTTGPLVKAIRAGISVISMHLNLDAAPGGIDESLARALGAEETKILRPILGDAGYGRAFSVGPIRFSAYLENVRKTFGDRVIAYGEDRLVSRVASFCGGGAGDALVRYAPSRHQRIGRTRKKSHSDSPLHGGRAGIFPVFQSDRADARRSVVLF